MIIVPLPGKELLKALEFSKYGEHRDVFCYVNEVTFGGHLKMGMVINGAKQVIRGLEISVPLPILKVGERGRGLNQSPMANVLVNHDTVEKPL